MPQTTQPTETDYLNYSRYAVAPLQTLRQRWVESEAQAIFTARTGRADPFPQIQDYLAANQIIPTT